VGRVPGSAMAKYNILTLNNISPAGLAKLPADAYLVGGAHAAPDAILVRSHKMHDMQIPASVKAVGRAGAGTDNVPVARLSARGVPVFNAPGGNANAVNELVHAALLIASRNLAPALQFVNGLQEADDKALHQVVEEKKKRFAGIELPERTLGIIGLGAIGSLVANTAIKLGMRVVGYDPAITVEGAWRLPSAVRKANSVEELIKASDFISLHVPLLEATRKLVNDARVALMRPNTVLLNFARDGLVDEDAVLAGIQAQRIKYYLTDFPAAKLRDQPAVIAFPHLGASTAEAEDNCAVMVCEQVKDYLENGNILNSVNFPDVRIPREVPYRVGIANANEPKMLARISTAMGEASLNIHDMINKSKAEMAYTLVDIDSPVSAAVIEKIAAIPGVLSVRAIPLQGSQQ
jgi:D-3-phosphoglycerate dehydrogenase / 2-oxoglutarate reductase